MPFFNNDVEVEFCEVRQEKGREIVHLGDVPGLTSLLRRPHEKGIPYPCVLGACGSLPARGGVGLDSAASVRITTACFASLAFTPGVLFAHYKRADTYGSPLELFFGVVFALSLAMAVIGLPPALLA